MTAALVTLAAALAAAVGGLITFGVMLAGALRDWSNARHAAERHSNRADRAEAYWHEAEADLDSANDRHARLRKLYREKLHALDRDPANRHLTSKLLGPLENGDDADEAADTARVPRRAAADALRAAIRSAATGGSDSDVSGTVERVPGRGAGE